MQLRGVELLGNEYLGLPIEVCARGDRHARRESDRESERLRGADDLILAAESDAAEVGWLERRRGGGEPVRKLRAELQAIGDAVFEFEIGV